MEPPPATSTGLLDAPVLNVRYLPHQALFAGGQNNTQERPGEIGWRLSPEPFLLSRAQQEDLRRLGPVLARFLQAIDQLYRESNKGQQPAWVSDWLNRGKPQALLQFAQMNRFKQARPLVIRPDLLMTETGWALCEIDSVPGGIGFTAAMAQAYEKSGLPVLGPEQGDMLDAFWTMLRACVPDHPSPVAAIVLADEAADYRAEMTWLANTLREERGAMIYVVHPKQLALMGSRLVMSGEGLPADGLPIDIVYRFFEQFDLPNVPNIELIQFAAKRGWVTLTPPLKPWLEEKLPLALLHHPRLSSFWAKQLGQDDFEWLRTLVPQGWVVDPTPLPPQAVIPGLVAGGQPIQSFADLGQATQRERALVLKPSGFSPLAWGSRGVTVGHDVPATEWADKIQQAMAAFETTPYLLQVYHRPTVVGMERLEPTTGERLPFPARVRLCPYYFVTGEEPVLAGALVTGCPVDKKVIHGMKDAILVPVARAALDASC